MLFGKHFYDLNKETRICGILNVTPDSFSDGGKYSTKEAAIKRAEEMVRDGASLIDIGGESTRPGFTPVSPEEECERVIPVLLKIKEVLDIPVSVDTSKVLVAKEALLAGADVINDIWGLSGNEEMGRLIAEKEASCILMHNRTDSKYQDFLPEVLADLRCSVDTALKCGISTDKIMVDPGIGFAKNYEQNLTVLKHLEAFRSLHYPVFVGASNKSVIGTALDLPVGERLEGTLATTALAVVKGCAFVRVHDVRANLRVVKMLQTIIDKG